MAEKPRLKKSNEILGSIASEPARPKRAGAAPDKNGGQAGQEPNTKPKSSENDFIEEDIELTDGPILPSAQSLAEKLLPKKPLRQWEFGVDEPSKPGHPKEARAQAAPGQTENARPKPKPEPESKPKPQPERKPEPEPAPVPEIEFGISPASNSATVPATVEFQAAPGAAAPVAIEFATDDSAPAPPPPGRGRPAPKTQPAPLPVQEFEAAPAVSEYTFQSFEQTKPAEDTSSVWEFSTQDAAESGKGRKGRKAEKAPEPQPGQRQQAQPQPRREKIIQPLRAEVPVTPSYEPLQTAFAFEPQQQAAETVQAPPQPPVRETPAIEPEISEAERNRQDFLKRIANQFELQFEEKFGDGAKAPRPLKSSHGQGGGPYAPPPCEPLSAPEPKPPARPAAKAPVPLDDQIEGEDFLSYVQRQERERRQRMGGPAENRGLASAAPESPPHAPEPGDDSALGFIQRFENDIRKEESRRSEDFKETLSQKFMRERERYLKELDIGDDEPDLPDADPGQREPAAPPVAPQRRKLDFQIQPEMHMQNGEAPLNPRPANGAGGRPARPVTYTRGGAASPQSAPEDTGQASGGGASTAGGKKTGEQLLLEHSIHSRKPAMPKAQPAKLKFTFETPEERAQKSKGEKEGLLPTEKWPRRIIIVAMVAGLFALALVIWSMVSYYNLSSGLSSGSEPPASELPVNFEDTLDVYNDRVFTQTATANAVIFKNAGTMLKNAHVNDYVVIENVDGVGRIRLEDVQVGSAISVKSGGVDAIELHNVKAARLIVNNPQAAVTVSATGSTDIDVVELRTKSTVRQSDLSDDFAGIGGIVVTAAEQGGSVDAKLDGLSLRTLETAAGTAILEFVNNTRAESASADGSLSLSGSGKISSLSIGAKVGQGAGDFEDRKDITLFVKDVSISGLNVKSPANLNLATTVDSISTADAITLGGEASVGSLTLNPKAGSSSRLLIDIVAANIQSVYSNTPARINVTGASRINELTADEPTYALGNKVNHLKVNADGVIYENEPDKITIASGIRPPQSKADNPNINYDLGISAQSATDVTGEDFATTCGHSRESGGFLLGDGSKDAPYEVATAMQLAHVGSHLASHFIQTADIDISTESAIASNFPVIGGSGSPFEGVFDGRGFVIARLKIVSQNENIGLFGANKGTIQNVHLYSGEITSASTSPSLVGGIAGLNFDGGQIRSCANGAAINGNQNSRTGGIAGGSYGGRIHDCYNYAKISGVNIVGGIVGLNRQGASVTGSYNAGVTDGSDEVGSVAGKNEDATVANCYYLIDTCDFGIGSGDGTANERTSEELADPQMAADLSAGNESSLWISGSATGSYRYPVHRIPSG